MPVDEINYWNYVAHRFYRMQHPEVEFEDSIPLTIAPSYE